jgi:mannosylglycerate hydrolase
MSEPVPAPASPRARPVHVVPHTHWDREWYRPFERYRHRLVHTLDRVLAADLPYFLLDGQTAVIDDYLAMRPEQAGLLRERIKQGRLGVGPWFVLVDEFLVSGESLVRNLHMGRAAMRTLGTRGEGVGYLPDMFGHIGQMPQILTQFGLDLAVVWRGVAPPSPRFIWRSPDGTGITTAWLPLGYYQTMFMEELPLATRQEQLEKYVAAFDGSPSVWLLAGADHMAPRADLAALIGKVQAESSDEILGISSLRDALLGPLPTAEVVGELRDASKSYLLPGVLSARVPLKVANAACQTLLERYVEPLASMAWWNGASYPTPFVTQAWRSLMLNHPHDSICGCSIDQVHREMWPRFAAVEQIGEEVLAEAVRLHSRPVAAPGVFIFNPTGWDWEGWLEVDVDWPLSDATPGAISLEGVGLLEVISLGHADTEVFCAEIDFNPDWFAVRRFRLALRVKLPGMGGIQLDAAGVEVAPSAVTQARAFEVEQGPTPSAFTLENGLVSLRIAQGRVDLHDVIGNQTFFDCHGFVDEGDAGDEYNFSPLAGDNLQFAVLRDSRVVENGPHLASLEARYELIVPSRLSPDRSRRDGPPKVMTLLSRFTLRSGSPRVEVETAFVNEVEDHRLRVLFRWNQDQRPVILAEGTFGVFERPPVSASSLPVPKGVEAVMPEFPTSGFTALVGETASLSLATPGLYEAAWLEEGALAVTLLRSVGWLSRDDLRTRGGGAGPRFETPEAQCLGAHVLRYAMMPGGKDWTPLLALAHQFAAPPRVWVARGIKSPGLSLGDDRLVVSALVRSQDGRSMVLRAFNACGAAVSGCMELGFEVGYMVESRMDETPGKAFMQGVVAFGPYEVKTWLLYPPH